MNDWRVRAACRDEDPDLFHPVTESKAHHQQIAEAKAVCARCPVEMDCLADALGQPSVTAGIWGGTTEAERAQMVRAGHRVAPPASAADGVAVERGLRGPEAAVGMHEHDRAALMQHLTEQGMTVSAVAARAGTSPKTVRRVLGATA